MMFNIPIVRNVLRKYPIIKNLSPYKSMSTVQSSKVQDNIEFTPESMYVMYSNLSLDYIKDELLSKHGNAAGIGPMKIETFKGKETNRTLVFLSKDIYESLEMAGLTSKGRKGVDFRVSPYKLRPFDLPKEGHGPNLFIPLESKYSTTEYRDLLEGLISEISQFGLFDFEDVLVKIPLKTRSADDHKGMCFISFKKTVPVEHIACLRSFLFGYEHLQCFWSKPTEKAKEKSVLKTSTSSANGSKSKSSVDNNKKEKGPTDKKASNKKASNKKDKKANDLFQGFVGDFMDKILGIDMSESAINNMEKLVSDSTSKLGDLLNQSSCSSDGYREKLSSLFKNCMTEDEGDIQTQMTKVKDELEKIQKDLRKEFLKNNFVIIESSTENVWGKKPEESSK